VNPGAQQQIQKRAVEVIVLLGDIGDHLTLSPRAGTVSLRHGKNSLSFPCLGSGADGKLRQSR
jgi:hypothetical protein